MNPSSGESAPAASMSRSDSSREVSVTTSKRSRLSGRSPVRSTSAPPWGLIRPWPVPGTGRVRCGATVMRPPSDFRCVDRSLQTAARAEPARPAGDIASDVSCRHLGARQTQLLELVEDDTRRLLRRMLLGVDPDLGVARLFVRVGDAGELLELAAEGLLVEPLDVAPRALLHGRRHVDLDERAVLLDQLARVAASLLVRRDCGDEHCGAVAGQSRSDPADALDVRVAVLLREAEALREVRAHDVAVQGLDEEAAALEL